MVFALTPMERGTLPQPLPTPSVLSVWHLSPGISVAAHIADGVVLALHLGQQDFGIPNKHCYHASFGQIMGLRNLDKQAHPRRSSPCHRLHIRSDHLPEVGPDAAMRAAARYVRQAGLD